jgi:hypothetical protein
LNEGTPKKGFERLVLAHARGSTTSLYGNCEHLGVL